MALVKCKKCKAEVSSVAKVCPTCGVKSPGTKWWHKLIVAAVLVFLIVLVFSRGAANKDGSVNTPEATGTDQSARTAQGTAADTYSASAQKFTVTKTKDFSFAGRNRNQVFIVVDNPGSDSQIIGSAVQAIKDLQRETHCVVCDVVVEVSPGSASDGDTLALVHHVADGLGNGGETNDGQFWFGTIRSNPIQFQ
jgi:hypothetical protein